MMAITTSLLGNGHRQSPGAYTINWQRTSTYLNVVTFKIHSNIPNGDTSL
jgi:hypothetical protein